MSSDRAMDVTENADEKNMMSGALFAKGYKADPKMDPIDVWRHFTTRGHQGRVTCVAANADANIIITGGVDFSLRVWRFDNMYESFALVAVLNLPVPKAALDQATEAMSCFEQFKGLIVPKKISWDNEPSQGVSAINFICDFETSPAGPRMSQTASGTIGGKQAQGMKEKKRVINGPIICGAADGSLHVLDFAKIPSAKDTSEAVYTHEPQMHTGMINDICTLPDPTSEADQGLRAFFVLTASEDGTSRILIMKVKEVDSPVFKPREDIKRNWIVDLLFFAGGGRSAMHELEEADKAYQFVSMEDFRELQHPSPVFETHCLDLDFDNMEDDSKRLVAFITCTSEGMFLWNVDGDNLAFLKVSTKSAKVHGADGAITRNNVIECKKHTSVASVIKRTTAINEYGEEKPRVHALLFLHGTGVSTNESDQTYGYVGVWGIQDGILGQKDKRGALIFNQARHESFVDEILNRKKNQKGQHETTDAEPLCVYQRTGDLLDVDQSGFSTKFALQLGEDQSTVDMWSLQAIAPGSLVVEPDGPGSLLVTPGKEELLLQFAHRARVADIIVVENAEGPAMLTGCEDGSVFAWDLDGDDKGQIYAELRSLTALEIIMPPLVLFITSAQLLSFAFGPGIPWQGDVHENAKLVHHICIGDINMVFEVDKEMIFWPEMICIRSAMLLFMLTAVFGLDERMDDLVAKGYNWQRYRDERYSFGPAHLLVKLTTTMRTATYLFMQLCSTVLVVPMMKAVANAVHCIDQGEGLVVKAAPTVQCFKGRHLQLTISLSLLVFPFLFMLIPFAVVGGDAHYVPSNCLFEWKFWQKKNAWRLSATRKATTLHLGFLHVNPHYVFVSLAVELAGKIALPVAATLMAAQPLTQMILISTLNFGMWFNSMLHAPYVERKFCVVVQGLKLLIFVAAATGVLTVIHNDPSSFLSVKILLGATLLLIIMISLQLCLVESQKPCAKKFNIEDVENAKNGGSVDEEAPLLEGAGAASKE
mmetsp:Transcript_98176/g.283233  ORF Transcript_98176/g.283233 Transcript_98176/m.283233 type:complete len:991 (+) Transcript_98176:71-3043(+)